MDKEKLNTKAVDIITSGISASVGMIPYAGGFLSELINNIIPNQREDRIVKFILEINDKLEEMNYSIEQLKEIFSNYKYGAFTYKCIRNVVNEVYDEKIQYYKNICLNGLTSEEKNLNQTERILNIFSEMDYWEILYLKLYYHEKNLEREQFFETQEKLNFTSLDLEREKSKEKLDEELYRQIALNNLLKNSLLEQQIATVEDDNQIKEQYTITNLGEIILKKLEIV